MRRAVIYARYSSASQREESIEGQIRICTDYANRNGYTIVGEYIDRAMSGTVDARPDFQRMIDDSSQKMFDSIIVYSVDRFARDRYDSAFYKRKIRKNGVSIHYASTEIPDSPEGIILESVMEGMAEYYSAELSIKIRRGLMENVLNGKTVGSHLPYGYNRVDGRYAADPDKIEIVRMMFEMYANGMSSSQIANWLNEKGIRTRKGGKWTRSGFNRIWTNRCYIGEYSYNGVDVPGACDRIIDDDLFNAVQEKVKMMQKKGARNKASEAYLLSGKVYCGKCDSAMIGESGAGKSGAVHRYYKCYNRKIHHNCDKKTVKKEVLEQAVVKAAVDYVLTDEMIHTIAMKTYELQVEEREANALVKSLEAQQAEAAKAAGNLMKALETGVTSKMIAARIDELEREQADLALKIEQEKIRMGNLIMPDAIEFWLHTFKDGNVEDITYCKKIINALIDKVYVYDDDGGTYARIIFNVSENNTKEVTLSDIDKVAPPNSAYPNQMLFYVTNSMRFGLEIRVS